MVIHEPERFADAWNFYAFQGKPVIRSEELSEADPVMVYNPDIGKEKRRKKVIPDNIKLWKGKYLRLLVNEYQAYIDYGMIFRNMLTEAAAYDKQRRIKQRRHRKAGDLCSDERGNRDMCKAWEDQWECGRKEGRAEGIAEGRAEGIEEGRKAGRTDAVINNIKKLMKNARWTAEQAMNVLEIPASEQAGYMAML